jgi:hypothetical protein
MPDLEGGEIKQQTQQREQHDQFSSWARYPFQKRIR